MPCCTCACVLQREQLHALAAQLSRRAPLAAPFQPLPPFLLLSRPPLSPAVGIGMLLAFTGLRSMGVITFDSATLVSLGGCPANHRNYLYAFDQQLNETSLAALDMSSLPPPASVYGCVSQNVRGVVVLLVGGAVGGWVCMRLVVLKLVMPPIACSPPSR